jgi:hypothetical protein
LIMLRDILEVIYYVSGIVLVGFGFYGLKQVKIGLNQLKVGMSQVSISIEMLEIAKQDVEIRSKREAAILAIQQSEMFAREVLPQFGEIKKAWKKYSIPEFEFNGIFTFNRNVKTILDFQEKVNKAVKWRFTNKSYQLLFSEYISVCNKLESLASYFIKEIADDNVVFESIGKAYCNIIESLYPYICLIDEKNELYVNLKGLYRVWKIRIVNNESISNSKVVFEGVTGSEDLILNPIGTKSKGLFRS